MSKRLLHYHPLVHHRPLIHRDQPRPARRFFRALAIAAIILFLSAKLLYHLIFNPYFRIDIDHDTRILGCQEYNKLSPSSFSLSLPISAQSLFLLSRGAHFGQLNINHSPHIQPNSLNVEIRAGTLGQRRRARICLLTRPNNQHGIGIFSSNVRVPWPFNPLLSFHITATFPTPHPPLSINKFETDLPKFNHIIGPLAGPVDFHTFRARGSMSFIFAESLSANYSILNTSWGTIRGTFESAAALSLHTTHSPINIQARLHNNNNSIPTIVTLETSNSPIIGNFTFLTPNADTSTDTNTNTNIDTDNNPSSAFSIFARSSNGPLNLTIPTAPLNSALFVHAGTTNSPAALTLPLTFEGSFSLHTTHSPARVTYNASANPEDPAGRGRNRIVWFKALEPVPGPDHNHDRDRTRTQLRGTVYWSEKNRERGSVTLRTSNSPVFLAL